jgi:hypothetical protein
MRSAAISGGADGAGSQFRSYCDRRFAESGAEATGLLVKAQDAHRSLLATLGRDLLQLARKAGIKRFGC